MTTRPSNESSTTSRFVLVVVEEEQSTSATRSDISAVRTVRTASKPSSRVGSDDDARSLADIRVQMWHGIGRRESNGSHVDVRQSNAPSLSSSCIASSNSQKNELVKDK